MIRKTTIALAALLALSGCASLAESTARTRAMQDQARAEAQQRKDTARLQLAEQQHQLRATAPVCHTDEECSEMWSAAEVWIAQNAGMKLQIATDNVLETYAAPRNGLQLAFKVVKERAPGDSKRLVAWAGCSNAFGCTRNPADAVLAFNEYVGRAAD